MRKRKPLPNFNHHLIESRISSIISEMKQDKTYSEKINKYHSIFNGKTAIITLSFYPAVIGFGYLANACITIMSSTRTILDETVISFPNHFNLVEFFVSDSHIQECKLIDSENYRVIDQYLKIQDVTQILVFDNFEKQKLSKITDIPVEMIGRKLASANDFSELNEYRKTHKSEFYKTGYLRKYNLVNLYNILYHSDIISPNHLEYHELFLKVLDLYKINFAEFYYENSNIGEIVNSYLLNGLTFRK